MTDKDSSAAGSKPMTPFVHTRPANNEQKTSALLCFLLKSKCLRDRIAVVKNFNQITIRDISQSRALEAEVLEKQQMLAKSEHQSSLIQKQFVDLQLKFQNYKERLQNEKVCVPPNATASNAIVEINQLKYQLQRKDDTIRNLETQINIMRMLNVGPTTGSRDQQALETEVTIENASLPFDSKMIGEDGYLKMLKLQLKAEAVAKRNSGPIRASETQSTCFNDVHQEVPKYIVTTKRAIGVQTELVAKKEAGDFQIRQISPRPAQKPQVQQHKKPTVPVNVFQKPKPATVARKPNPKNNFRNHSRLPTKSVKARRAADYYRNLYVDIGQFVVHSTKSVHVKTHQAKCAVNTSKNAWKATKEDVARIVPQWKPTGKRFNLCDIYGPRMSTEPIVRYLKFTPCLVPPYHVTCSMEPFSTLWNSPHASVLVQVPLLLWSLGFLTIDSAIARLVPMGFLPSLNDERTTSIRKSDTSVLEDLKAFKLENLSRRSLLNLSDHSRVLPEVECPYRLKKKSLLHETYAYLHRDSSGETSWKNIHVERTRIPNEESHKDGLNWSRPSAARGKAKWPGSTIRSTDNDCPSSIVIFLSRSGPMRVKVISGSQQSSPVVSSGALGHHNECEVDNIANSTLDHCSAFNWVWNNSVSTLDVGSGIRSEQAYGDRQSLLDMHPCI
ncbi:hypothetical protein Tco_0727090 [Tanacetum coccineum]|uniref:Uncharacterized protein n=1 Tax=Tanacetum coccineum TaxID=301880 RepID=A0ABQ4YHF4_9ASTR